ncbi:MAG TPA: hypothetical protein VGV38_11175 [Pyrinomonadaceae bacterium]|nr:hypothetical protein [Pyrinomonadaceae bacterium]
MATKKKEAKHGRRTQVKELPKEEKELSKDEQKQVKGGMHNIMSGILDNMPKR